ncbi:GNAT family N-acetyltransferase [Actinoplanes sp. GCM10030250]|uniref:GNAT family N-acetyltransferase n=1 Tax=Actinoplanes sp. GCM10030250 TaxID=3273376 RepID=UPI003606B3C0
MIVSLRPFTAELLPVVQPWFHHPEVNRWLGGPDWPAMALREQDEGPFRGRRVLRTHTWVAVEAGGEVVAYAGGEVYDRWSRYHERPEGPVVTDVEPGPAMGLAYVVAPHRWRQGYGTATLRAIVNAPEMADVVVFAAGIEPENVASVRCAEAAGFLRDDPEPDFEGIVHYVLRR